MNMSRFTDQLTKIEVNMTSQNLAEYRVNPCKDSQWISLKLKSPSKTKSSVTLIKDVRNFSSDDQGGM